MVQLQDSLLYCCVQVRNFFSIQCGVSCTIEVFLLRMLKSQLKVNGAENIFEGLTLSFSVASGF